MPAKGEPLGIKSNTTIQVTNSAHTTVGSMCWCILVRNTLKHTPRSTTPHSCARVRPYTRAVHKTARSERCCSDIARPEKNVANSTPSKWRGGLTGTKKRLPLPSMSKYVSFGFTYPCLRVLHDFGPLCIVVMVSTEIQSMSKGRLFLGNQVYTPSPYKTTSLPSWLDILCWFK